MGESWWEYVQRVSAGAPNINTKVAKESASTSAIRSRRLSLIGCPIGDDAVARATITSALESVGFLTKIAQFADHRVSQDGPLAGISLTFELVGQHVCDPVTQGRCGSPSRAISFAVRVVVSHLRRLRLILMASRLMAIARTLVNIVRQAIITNTTSLM